MTRIVFIGGGGFAKEVLEIAELCGHTVVAYVADMEGTFEKPYWGVPEILCSRGDDFDAVFIAFGSFDRTSSTQREKFVNWVITQEFTSLPLISPKAIISKNTIISPGSYIAHGAILSVDVVVEPFAIINTRATVGHGAKIGRNTNLAPCSFVAGNAQIGNNSLIAPGALVLEKRIVAANVVVGVGATVLQDIPEGKTVMPILSRAIDRSGSN